MFEEMNKTVDDFMEVIDNVLDNITTTKNIKKHE